ncbi:EAL domain-containing protein [Anaerorhabdus sp.]|uniref:EAL domain-containing protein n=1 Tax=Anaerorhabdus sp. TaxID=1872524 RepID=UPI002FC69B0D
MKKKTIFVISLTVILVTFLLAVFVQFNNQLKDQLNSHIKDHLEEIVKPNVVSFNMQIKEQIKRVNAISRVLGEDGYEIGSQEQIDFLKVVIDDNIYEDYIIALPDGVAISCTDNSIENVSDKTYFEKSLQGESYVTLPEHYENIIDPVIMLSAPITRNDTVVGVLICKYPSTELDSIFNTKLLYNLGEIYVVDKDGDKIIGHSEYTGDTTNLFEFLSQECATDKSDSFDKWILNNETKTAMIVMNKTKKAIFLTYTKLDYGDWYMVAMVDEKEAYKSFDNIFNEQQKYIGMISGGVIVYLIILLALTFSDVRNVDRLTGGLTLRMFKYKAVKELKKNSSKAYVFVKIDIRNFKLINRIYSYDYGDQVIKNIAKSLEVTAKKENGIFCRVAIDEFIILLPFKSREYLDEERNHFIELFSVFMGEEFNKVITFPTGQFIVYKDDPERLDIDGIIEKVNFAHREAKKRSGDIIIDYVEDLENKEILAKSIEDRMNSAMENDEFKLYLQPKVDILNHNVVSGAEALIRWEYDGNSFMYPNDFIPILESNGYIVKTDMLMFEKSVKFLRNMIDNNLKPIRISVNFSRIHLANKHFVEELCKIADKYAVPHEYLEVELTESVLSDNVMKIQELISELHRNKFTLAIDDFGSGYSSLSLLKDIEVDVVKIDKEFFVQSKIPNRSKIVIENIITMSNDLNALTVAEGIEIGEQVEILRDLNCDMIQGYYFFRPMNADKIDLEIFNKEYTK